MTLQTMGSIVLKIFNDKELTEGEARQAFLLSPLVGHALRAGRDPSELESVEAEMTATREFLTKDLVKYLVQEGLPTRVTLEVTPMGEDHCFVLPWESRTVKWYGTCVPRNGTEWCPVVRDLDVRMYKYQSNHSPFSARIGDERVPG
jgi:hypothetical protein